MGKQYLKNLEQQCRDGSIILSRAPKALAFLGLPFGALITQIEAEKVPREGTFFYTFPPRNLPRESLPFPSASTPSFCHSNCTENLKIWKGLRGRNWEALWSLLPTTLTWNSSRCPLHTLPLSLELPGHLLEN